MDYCYRFRDQIFDFQRGFDPAYMVLGPGSLLTGYVIDHAMQEGNKIYDMLRGEYDYKTLWVKEQRETRFFRAYRPGPVTLLYCSRYEWFRGLMRLLARCRSLVTKPTVGA
jgi:CelD/BcsL family acetyltransferase involved in cellulose biosynthesis